jgi:hypothetical protein
MTMLTAVNIFLAGFDGLKLALLVGFALVSATFFISAAWVSAHSER